MPDNEKTEKEEITTKDPDRQLAAIASILSGLAVDLAILVDVYFPSTDMKKYSKEELSRIVKGDDKEIGEIMTKAQASPNPELYELCQIEKILNSISSKLQKVTEPYDDIDYENFPDPKLPNAKLFKGIAGGNN